jgi:predicted phage terminase large subunit-like protein
MQRLHEDDVSGVILSQGLGYEHLCLPMRFEEARRCETSIGFVDEREEGELLFPERFPEEVVARDERAMGPYATAGQFQQTPSPRGGGILKRDYWQLWDEEESRKYGVRDGAFPIVELVVASLDTAMTEKKENDPSGFTIWGLWKDKDGINRAILMNAWAKRLQLHGGEMERLPNETDVQFKRRCSDDWGLVEWVIYDCRRFKADVLLVESKANGIDVVNEIRRLCKLNDFGVRSIDPGSRDKVARAYAVQPTFANGKIYAPDRDWADQVITECEVFPKGAHDDRVDSTTQAIQWFRANGLLDTGAEIQAQITAEALHRPKPKLVYEA